MTASDTSSDIAAVVGADDPRELDLEFGSLLRATAHTSGPHQALDILHESAGQATLWCGPAGHAVASPDTAAHAERLARGTTVTDRTQETVTDLSTWVVQALGLAALGCPLSGPADPDRDHRPVAWGLAWLRLGLSERLLAACLDHLSGRRVGPDQLLRQQLVKGTIADVVIIHLSVETVLDELGHAREDIGDVDATLRDAHADLSRADRMTLRLLGAKGFAVDGPGQLATTSELLADTYVTPRAPGAAT